MRTPQEVKAEVLARMAKKDVEMTGEWQGTTEEMAKDAGNLFGPQVAQRVKEVGEALKQADQKLAG